MKTPILSTLLFFFLFFITGCKKELEPQESFANGSTPAATGEIKNTSTTPTNGQAPQNTTAVNNASANSAAVMNPAHGQPGHRCDIAVGAPLTGTPNKGSATQISTNTVQPGTTTIQPTQTKVAAGMNPPHGQPGHRCDIQAGAPLNSPVTKTVASTSKGSSGSLSMPIDVSAPATNGQASTPALLNPTPVAEGMNPAHGQPGHVCSVAVGAPLPK